MYKVPDETKLDKIEKKINEIENDKNKAVNKRIQEL